MKNLEVVYVDNVLLVLNKPAGLLSVPGKGSDKQDCLSHRAQSSYPDALVVHRLDMATSGLMMMARSVQVQRLLNQAFAARIVQKQYTAIVSGLLTPTTQWHQIDLPIALDWVNRPKRIIDHTLGKSSATRWRSIAVDATTNTSRLLLEPITGRSHQLRVHMQAMGHAILGDLLYAPEPVAQATQRLMLHACKLELRHPIHEQHLKFDCPVPF